MSARWTLPPLTVGEFAPSFAAATRANPKFHFNTLPGRYVLLAFMPDDEAARAQALTAFAAVRPRFDDGKLTAFFVTTASENVIPPDAIPGQRWMFDPDNAVGPRFHSGPAAPAWFLFDPHLRLLASSPIAQPAPVFDIIARLPPPTQHAGAPLVAPVMIVPRVFEPDLCRRLIAYYDETGGKPSGVMRDIGGKTVGVLDGMKRRSDVFVQDEALRGEVLDRLQRNLVPMIWRGFQFRATRLERYLVACYDAQEGGWFNPHRDDESLATAHRRFACSINLNAEDFEGGDLRFPEFGPRTYRPPTGGAVVFSCSLQHAATEVTRGRRYAFLPFLFDEAGARIREQNQGFLQTGPAVVLDNR
jgi:predicted 2-oxoglutarate/Fe(II)-dependent dioxygenase YbiX